MPDVRGNAKRAGIAGIISIVVIICAPFTQPHEGLVPTVRPDPANIPTVCYGETENIDPLHVYTKDECGALLRKRLERDYAPKVLACIPSFKDHPYPFAAALDAAYNAGPAAVCKSPMAKAFNAGNYAAGCDAFRGWYVTARDRKTGKRLQLKGLVNRRNAERDLCRKEFA